MHNLHANFSRMKKHLFASLVLLVPLALFMNSCDKDEGTGGNSSITGKVRVRQYNTNFTYLVEEYGAQDEDVFIIYGDDPVYGDKVSTNYDGTYRFEYLREGNYTVFAYSEDSAGYPTKHLIPVFKKVKVNRNQDIVVEDLVILK